MTNVGCEGTNQICDPNNLSCSGCSSNEQCGRFHPERPICSARTRECSACEIGTNQGCTAENPVCKVLNGEHACQPCQTDQECANTDGAVCDQGRCVECAADEDCQNGERCAVVNGTRTCASCDPSQPEGQNGCAATNPLCTQSGECGACLTSADCPTRTPICGNDHQCRACLDDAECLIDGLICGSGLCSRCDETRTAPDNPNVDLGCTVEQPNCRFGGTRCTQ